MAENISKQAIVVLGAGRTGTSLAMQVLHQLGMTVSDTMTPPSEQNQMGGFEDTEIFSLQSELLDVLQTNQLYPLPDGWLSNPEVMAKKKQLADIVQNRIANAQTIWGFKDPRTALFLPLWFQVFNPHKIVAQYILAVRSPVSTIRSLKTQYAQGEEISELFWLHKNCAALTHTGSNVFIVHYEDWFTRPVELARELLATTGLDAYFSGDVQQTVQEVIKPQLNRAAYHETYAVQNEYVVKLYDALQDCRGDDFDRDRLMSVVQECSMAIRGFKGWYVEAQKHLARQNQLSKRLEKTKSSQNNEHVQQIKDLKRQLQETTSQNNEHVQQIKDLHEEKEELRITLSSSMKELKKAKQDKDNAIKKIKDFEQGEVPVPNRQQGVNSNAPVSGHKWQKEVHALRNSTSFRLGQALVNAVVKPGKNTVLMPFRVVKILFEDVFARQKI